MPRFFNSSIKLKLILLSAFALIGFSVILIGNLMFFQQSNQQLERVQTVDLRTVQIANELLIGLADLNRLFEAVVVEMDQDTLGEALKLASSQRAQITQIGNLNSSMLEDARSLINLFDDYIKENQAYADDVIAGRLSGDAMYGAFSTALGKRNAYDLGLRAMGKRINGDFATTLQDLRDGSAEVAQQQFTFAALLFLLFALAIIWFSRVIARAIENVISVAGQIAQGNLDVEVGQAGSEELQRLFYALEQMRDRLKHQSHDNQARQKRQNQLAKLNEALRGEKGVQVLGENILRCLADEIGTLVGAFYLLEGNALVLKASHAFTVRRGDRNRFMLGESLVGQAGLEQQQFLVRDLPAGYATIASGLGEAVPREVLLVPLVLNGKLLGVIELLSFRSFTEDDIEFIRRGGDGMAIALNSSLSRVQLAEALEQTRRQAEALEQQQEELRATNEELEEQASTLRASEEHLQQQQEELRVMNEELEERNALLDRQKEEIVRNNAALERSRRELQEKAKQLELSGRYKSEFLSTMSHELRTPLNSILILSQGLVENKQKNLDTRQVEHAQVIHSSGRDLLMLINDILDLSKVEEGKLELLSDTIELQALADKLMAQFETQAEAKGLQFSIRIDSGLPGSIIADEQRLGQILRNFLSNAFKFTHKGRVELVIDIPRDPLQRNDDLLSPMNAIAFRVKDSGIGIPTDKQDLIFEAFQQVDGTISRKYGGTGLGLTISRKLAELMGGGILVESEGENQGSTFSLILPREMAGNVQEQPKPTLPITAPAPIPVTGPASARETVENLILIVEDDIGFSRVLHGLAEEFGFKVKCVHSAADAYRFLEQHIPGSVILDLGLPDAPGEQLLNHIKSHPRTSRIPVHVISGNPNIRTTDLPGAQEFIAKPFGKPRLDQLFNDIGVELGRDRHKRVLVIEDDPVQREALQENFAGQNIPCDLAGSGEEAESLLKLEKYGAIILDLDLPDCDGFELLERIGKKKNGFTHIIIYTARDLTKKQDADLRRYADRIVLKTDKSIARLLNETSLFLHWLKGDDRRNPNSDTDTSDPLTTADTGQRILLVDDDIRNLYSLSAVLEESGLHITTASTGLEALEALDNNAPFNLILMDIMMPEMDGFEAMRRIRGNDQHRHIPIIALTAKAMRDDRARCIEAGANDYLSKPVDTGKLKTMIRMWLGQ
ncbi:MAG TPA: response regulator [Dongiaceae bacterium]|nr:response regulator [Dongiaceae bacterium]